jgi:hypothetical protein
VKNQDHSDVYCYNLELNIWAKCNEFVFPEVDKKYGSADGIRKRSFNYSYDYSLIPLIEGVPGKMTLPAEVRKLPALFFDAPEANLERLTRLGTLKDGQLLLGDQRLNHLFGWMSDDSWVILSPVIDSAGIRREEQREFRILWTGQELIAWGGSRLTKTNYACPCDEDHPCGEMPRSCQSVQRLFYNDGLIYKPDIEKWKCSFRLSPPDAGFLGVKLTERISLPDQARLKDFEPKRVESKQIKRSVLVVGTEKDSPAEKAGFKEKDQIIAINGNEITKASEFQNEILKLKKGSKIRVGIKRDGKTETTEAILEGTRRTIPANCPHEQ